ncbi:DRTGG domain-containing protein [Saccharicrinis aurantiacus]|uniref:DRTGG domain-containing protein n=1 Tax=Saccharicrinis aurantiacus TaxID=1849719 RepID=UPI00094FA10D|nr:DRTGG domain-containing protein [Saccharicrinis aurantiacus]
MTIKEIIEVTGAQLICGESNIDNIIEFAFSSDLMSDVLTQDSDQVLLITGLSNLQTIRTAEMADINYILIVRGKAISNDMIRLAEENHISLLQSDLSMFHISGLLYAQDLKPIF